MRVFVFSLAVCWFLALVPSGSQAQGIACNTTIVEENENTFVCGLKRLLFGKCKTKKKTKQVCVTMPTMPTMTTLPATTTEPTYVMDCSVDTFFPDRDDPSQYYQCQGNIPTLFKCPVTINTIGGPDLVQVWDQYSRSCMTTPTGEISCRESTGRQPDPVYCNMYIVCQNGVQSKIRCESGFRYNDVRRDCIMDSSCIAI